MLLLNADRAQKVMDKYGIDVLIATKPENVAYVCDYMIPGHKFLGAQVYAILPREFHNSSLILPLGEVADIICNKLTWIDDLKCYGTFYIETSSKTSLRDWERKLSIFMSNINPYDGVETLVRTLMDKKLTKSRIGFDEAGVTPSIFKKIRDSLPDADIIEAYDIFREIRMVKTAEEKKRIKESVNIAEKAIESTLETVRENMTVEQLVKQLSTAMIEQGALPAYPSIGISTENFVQNIPPTKKKLKQGDLIRFDVGCIYQYYYSDIARMAVLGKPSEKQKKYYYAVLEGEMRAIEAVKPGVQTSDVFKIAVQTVKKAGIPHYKRHHVGHGIGIELYDHPLITPFEGTLLEEGMVLNIECPYYEIGFGGVQVEDCIIVTKEGYEMISKSERELYQI